MTNTETLRALVDAVEAARSHLGAIRPDSRLYPEDAVQWDALTRVAALLSAGDGVAEGFVVVPREPTWEQKIAGQLGITTTAAEAIYCAMIAAAPTAKPMTPEHSHGGRPMTLREIMEAEEGAAPAGAIENGRALFEHIEVMDFECEGGPLRNCVDWNELRRCFEHLAECASKVAAPAVGVDEARQYVQVGEVFVDKYRNGEWMLGWTVEDPDDYPPGTPVFALTAALGREGGGNG
ncbi:hypothetical protein [Lysobacter antibioticus]|uniref:hypothetical protein n=1 Tax=Lysobacter antibioticus TaxID=84531 RepID=UPI0007E8D6A2|nr:hypothetical protein [Lysobacter antibioticus]